MYKQFLQEIIHLFYCLFPAAILQNKLNDFVYLVNKKNIKKDSLLLFMAVLTLQSRSIFIIRVL